ncbi:hypothetical protein Q0N88_33415, partial [Bacillus thuringiensis]
LLFRVVTKTVRDLLRADKPFFMHFIYVQNRCSTLYFYFALNSLERNMSTEEVIKRTGFLSHLSVKRYVEYANQYSHGE